MFSADYWDGFYTALEAFVDEAECGDWHDAAKISGWPERVEVAARVIAKRVERSHAGINRLRILTEEVNP